jgi:hypothetical protein
MEEKMEKQISIWSYRLGLVCAVLTILLRGLACFGIYPNLVPAAGASISYNTFLRGAVMLLVLSIASSFPSGSAAKS